MLIQPRSEEDHKNIVEQGFTLVELLIVIVILGILAGIVVFAVGNLTNSASKNSCATEQQTIQTAIAAFRAANPGKDIGSPAAFAAPTQDKIMADLTQQTVNGQAVINNTGAGSGVLASIPKNVVAGGFWDEAGTGTATNMWRIVPEAASGTLPTVTLTGCTS